MAHFYRIQNFHGRIPIQKQEILSVFHEAVYKMIVDFYTIATVFYLILVHHFSATYYMDLNFGGC